MRHFILLLVTIAVSSVSLQAQNAKTVADAIHYTKLANTLREVDKSPESISLLNRAMPAFISGKSVYWQAVATELIGLCYKDIKDTTNALAYLQKSLDLYGKLKYVASGWGSTR